MKFNISNYILIFEKKGEIEDKKYDQYFHFQRYISYWLSIPIYHSPLRPNQITFLSNFFQLIGVSLIAFLTDYERIYGVLFYFLGSIFDFIDGNIARAKNLQSNKGIYFDQIGHVILGPLFFVAIAFSAYFDSNNIIYLYISTFTGIFVVLVSFMIQKRNSLLINYKRQITDQYEKNEKDRLKKSIKFIYSRFYHYKIEILILFILIDKVNYLAVISLFYFFSRFFIHLYLDQKIIND